MLEIRRSVITNIQSQAGPHVMSGKPDALVTGQNTRCPWPEFPDAYSTLGESRFLCPEK